MKRYIVLFATLFAVIFSATAQSAEEATTEPAQQEATATDHNTLWDSANAAYNESNYAKAVELYEAILADGEHSAKLYYNLGTYLGNNYLSAEIVAKNALKTYPTNSYQEELNWLILQAKYQQMVNSMDSKKEERARETEDEYYSFITMYPESKHITAAEKIKKEILKILQ